MPHKSPEARAAYHRAYHAANRDKVLAYKAAYRAVNREAIAEDQHRRYMEDRDARLEKARAQIANCDPLVRQGYCLKSGAKIRAAERGMAFNLSREWILSRLRIGICEATGVQFDPDSTTLVATIDRRNNALGYTQANCWLVTRTFNSAKADRPLAEVAHLLRRAA